MSQILRGEIRWADRNVIGRRKEITGMERELRLAHIRRLQKGTPESLESSAAHLDILSSWKGSPTIAPPSPTALCRWRFVIESGRLSRYP